MMVFELVEKLLSQKFVVGVVCRGHGIKIRDILF